MFLAQTLINIVKSRAPFGKAYPGNFGMEHRISKPGMAGLSANVIKKESGKIYVSIVKIIKNSSFYTLSLENI